ncbi:MAG: hypothetical protein ACK500_06115 [Flavobacteriales bacterium]
MQYQSTLGWGQYAHTPLNELPAQYLLQVIRFEPPGSPLAALCRRLLDERSKADASLATEEHAFTPPVFRVFRRKKCPVNDKQQFPSDRSARKRIRQIQSQPGSNHHKVPQVAYLCPHCNHWHITSREKRKQAG